MRRTFASSLVVCLALASPALAQVSPEGGAIADAPTSGTTPQNASGAPATTAPQAGTATILGDIVVTARRRAESLEKVPVSVQAFTPERLVATGVRDTADLLNLTPSMNSLTTSGSGNAQPVYELRGISNVETLSTEDPAVGIYVNEVYQARPIGTNQPLLDVRDVQVLLGPQGTLFGRNSTAGAILIYSKRPSDKWEGEAGLTVGDYSRLDYYGILNIPVSDNFQIRIAAQRVKRDGYTRDINTGVRYDNEDLWSGRFSARYTTGKLENLTIADYFRTTPYNSALVLTEVVPIPPPPGLAPTVGFLYPSIYSLLAQQQARGPRAVAYNAPNVAYARAWGVSNITTYNLNSEVTIKNIFGYRNTKGNSTDDVDATVLPIVIGNQITSGNQFSDELQAQLKALDNRLNLISGVYYFRENGHEGAVASYLLGTPAAVNDFITDTNDTNVSASVFAQASYETAFLEGLSLTVGGRYTWDKRTVSYAPTVAGVFCALAPALQTGGKCFFETSKSFQQPTYNVTLNYQIDPSLMVYAAHRRGYRSGGFDPRATNQLQVEPYRPEIVRDAEVGAKGNWRLGGDVTLLANIAGYYTWYSDIQQQVVINDPNNPGTVQTVIRNAAQATINGVEFNTALQPAKGLRLTGFLGYVDGTYSTFATGGVIYHNIPFGVAHSTYGLGATYTAIDDPSIGAVSVTGQYSYRGKFHGRSDLPLLTGTASAQHLLNFTVDWDRIGGSRVSASVFVHNALDDIYSTGLLTLQTSLGFTANYYAPPRMFGASVKYAF